MKKLFSDFALLATALLSLLIPPQGPMFALAGGAMAQPLSPFSAPRDLPFYMATVLTNAGRAVITNRLRGSGTEPLNVGWGTGAGTSAAADTTLFTETATDLTTTTGTRTAGTSSQVTGTVTSDTYQVVATRTATGAGTVTNAGLWDNVTMGSGNLFLKGDFTGIGLASGDSIAFTVQLKFT